MAARKQPTLVDAYDVLTRIAESLEKLVGSNTITNDKAGTLSNEPIVEAVASGIESAVAQAKPLLPVSAPTTSAPAAEEKQTAPTPAEQATDAPTLESLQKTVQSFVRGIEGDPNAPDVDTQIKRMNQVQGLLLKSGKSSLKELDGAELAAFAAGLTVLMGGA